MRVGEDVCVCVCASLSWSCSLDVGAVIHPMRSPWGGIHNFL